MKYAVIELAGQQHKVKEGDEILVNLLKDKKPDPKVLLVVNDDKVNLGQPEAKGAKVSLKVLGDEKGEKLHIYKFKAKSRYRRKMGFRHHYTRLLVKKIS